MEASLIWSFLCTQDSCRNLPGHLPLTIKNALSCEKLEFITYQLARHHVGPSLDQFHQSKSILRTSGKPTRSMVNQPVKNPTRYFHQCPSRGIRIQFESVAKIEFFQFQVLPFSSFNLDFEQSMKFGKQAKFGQSTEFEKQTEYGQSPKFEANIEKQLVDLQFLL